ncbi:MAG: ABC transporter substrate-binding protein [Actinomycetes bacterium]
MITKFPSALRVSAVGALVASLTLTGATTAFAASPKAKKDSASAALVPAKYKSGLKVATDASYPPDEFVNAAGKIVGFDVELIDAIGVTLGVKVTTQNVTFDNIIPGIKSGKYAIGNSSFTDTKDRQKSVNFVDYFKAGEAFYTKSSTKSAPKTLADLCGSSVAVESGTVEETDAKGQKAKCTGGKTIRIDSFATQTEADLAVKSGRDAVGFADSQVAGYIVAQSKGAFKLSGVPFGVAPYGIATARTADGKKLALAIQSAIRVLIDNGVYKKILAKYGETSGSLKKSQIVLNGGK